MPAGQQLEFLLSGGDDYELLFTAAAGRADEVRAAGARAGVAVTCIGHIEARPGLVVVDEDGREQATVARGFDHFA